MALVHADNFSIYGTTAALMLNGVYADTPSVSLVTDPDGISGGYVMRISSNGTGGVRYVLTSASTTVGVAARVWCTNLSFEFYIRPTIAFYNSGGAIFCFVEFDTTGRAILKTGSTTGTTVATSVNPVITANGWYHLEAKLVTGAGATDSFELRVEGQTVTWDASVTGIDLTADSIYQVFLGNGHFHSNAPSTDTNYYKDFVIWDDSGSYNNDFLGSVLVTNLLPTSDVDLNWGLSTGTEGYSILDNIPPVDGTYIYAEDDPLPDPYVATLSDLPDDVTSVKGVITFVRAAKNDGGDGSLQVGLISDPDGTPATVLGTDRPITVAQTYWRDVFEEDPATTAPWLPAAVNDTNLQIDRTT
jgi:hypothetical protein